MRTIDILNLWDAFNRVYEAPALTNAEKRAIGDEVLNQLPRVDLCVTSHATLAAVQRSIQVRVSELEKTDGKPESEPERADPHSEGGEQGDRTQERQGTTKPKQLLRKAKPNP